VAFFAGPSRTSCPTLPTSRSLRASVLLPTLPMLLRRPCLRELMLRKSTLALVSRAHTRYCYASQRERSPDQHYQHNEHILS
jgi:hypothetical protein